MQLLQRALLLLWWTGYHTGAFEIRRSLQSFQSQQRHGNHFPTATTLLIPCAQQQQEGDNNHDDNNDILDDTFDLDEEDNYHYDFGEDDEDTARSQFGTRSYWDDVYMGRGDFPAEEYSWYFGWEILEDYIKEYIPLPLSALDKDDDDDDDDNLPPPPPVQILCPGIGNDPILVDLYRSKYTHLTAFDYSEHAIERQQDLISYELSSSALDTIQLHVMDARKLPNDWTEKFDAIIEKGALDAIYLSGDGNVELAIDNLFRCLKPGGMCLSVSGVVPPDLRRNCFHHPDNNDQDDDGGGWEWIRDGSDELKAGCFVFQKK